MEEGTPSIDTSAGTRAGGAWALLRFARAYELFQRAFSDEAREREFRERYLSVPDGALVLDIGCGTGRWRDSFGDVRYVGIEPSREYLERARRRHGGRGSFLEARAADLPMLDLPPAELVLCIGLLHHLDDGEMRALLAAAAAATAPSGRLVAVETCNDPGLSSLARLAGLLDRGRFVRASGDYVRAARPHWSDVRCEVTEHRTRVPFPLAVLECSGPRQGTP